MIDLHTHILPGLDDGAKTLDEALQMAKVAYQDGVRTVVATPHGVELVPGSTKADIQAQVAQLRQALEVEGLELQILPGVENYISPDLTRQLEAGQAFTLDSSPYFLVELPLQQYPLYTEQVLFELQIKGVIPVVAHPERNEAFQENPALLVKLIERGMLAQITAASVTGAFGSRVKAIAGMFLRANLVHVMASDAHSLQTQRAPVLTPGVEAAAKLIGWERAQALVTTIPESMLAGKTITVIPPELPRPKHSWAFWRRRS